MWPRAPRVETAEFLQTSADSAFADLGGKSTDYCSQTLRTFVDLCRFFSRFSSKTCMFSRSSRRTLAEMRLQHVCGFFMLAKTHARIGTHIVGFGVLHKAPGSSQQPRSHVMQVAKKQAVLGVGLAGNDWLWSCDQDGLNQVRPWGISGPNIISTVQS